MTIEQLPSGSYRIRQMYDGKRYSITLPYKPSKKEAITLMAEKLNSTPRMTSHKGEKGTCKYFIDNFIAERETRGLSPATIRNYYSIVRNMSEDFLCARFYDVKQEDIQREVSKYSLEHSPKSTHNFYGLIHSVFASYRPEMSLSIKLPSKQNKAEYEPSTADIQKIIEASVGTRYECAYKLAVLGLRRGEIVAITAADIDENNVLTINKDIVLDKNNKYVVKDKPKTEDSYRRILIPKELADLIRKQGAAYTGDPHSINKYLHTFQDKLGIPRFRLHMFRHFAVAYLHKAGFSDQQIVSYGGWSNSSDIMKRAYRYNLDPEESQKNISASLGGLM